MDEGMIKMNRAAYPRLFEPPDLKDLKFDGLVKSP